MATIEDSFANCTILEVITRPAKSRPLCETLTVGRT
jgi:hypothetical protein